MNESTKQDNSQITSEIRALIDSDDEPGCKRGYDPALCRMRHRVAKIKESRGMRHEYEPCAYCPKFVVAKPSEETTTPAAPPPEPPKPVEQIQAKPEIPKEKQPVKTYPRSTEKCHCGSTLSKNGYCYACKAWPNKSQPEETAQAPAPKTGANHQSMPGIGEFIQEPAATTIHASQPPKKEHLCAACGKNPADPNIIDMSMRDFPDKRFCSDCLGRLEGLAYLANCEACGNQVTCSEVPARPGFCAICAAKKLADAIDRAMPAPASKSEISELDVCRDVINKHGISRQLAKAAEEFSEAAAAISRFLAGEGEYTEIISEVADAEVMCIQMRLIYGASGIDQARAEKVARLHGRLKS